jgi:hypothetical protein
VLDCGPYSEELAAVVEVDTLEVAGDAPGDEVQGVGGVNRLRAGFGDRGESLLPSLPLADGGALGGFRDGEDAKAHGEVLSCCVGCGHRFFLPSVGKN